MKKNKKDNLSPKEGIAKKKRVLLIVLLFIISLGIIGFSLSKRDNLNNLENTRYFTGNLYTANHAANMLDYAYNQQNIVISPYNVNTSLAVLYNATDNNSKKEIKAYFKKDLNYVNEEINQKNISIYLDEETNNKYSNLYETYMNELIDNSYDNLTIDTIKLLSNKDKEEILLLIKKATLALERSKNSNNLTEKNIQNYKLTSKEISYNDYYIKQELNNIFTQYESYSIQNKVTNYTEIYTNNIEVNQEFKEKQNLEHITFTKLETNAIESAKKINDNIKSITHDNVSRVVSEEDIKEDEIIIINSLYFNYKWSEEFRSDKVSDTDFYKFNNEIEVVEMMYDIETTYYENSYAKAFSKNFENDKYSFIAILPNSSEDFSLSSLNIDNLLTSEKNSKTLIGIPKFSYQSETNMKDLASNYKINEVFTEKANLTKLTDDKTQITKMIQKTKISIGEKGTVNSTMSQSNLENYSEEDYTQSIILNRPFAFLIKNNENNEIILIGKVVSPNENS